MRLRTLVLTIGLMLLASPVMAQVDPLIGTIPVPGNGAAASTFAGSLGGSPAAFNAALFTTLYNNLMSPITAATSGIANALTGWVAGWFVAASACVLIVLALGSMLGRFQDDVVIRWGLRAGAVMMIAASSSGYSQWVSQPLLQLPTDIGGAVTGAVGQSFTNPGGVFDQIWNSLWNASDNAVRGVSLFSLAGLLIALLSLLATIGGSIFLFGTFAFYLITVALLQLLIAIGPIFVATLVFQPTRHLFSGWLSGVASQILTQTLIIVMLAIMTKTVLTELGNISGGTVNAGAALGELVGVAGSLCLSVILCFSIRQIASGVVGGVMANLGIATAAATMAVSAAKGAMSKATGSSGSASSSGAGASTSAPAGFPGRSLSSGDKS
jgi:type IV secretion system protein VirB6